MVVVATANGIHRSSDGGASFTQVTSGFTQAIVADPRMPTRIIGHLWCNGFRLSNDGGASFGNVLASGCIRKLIGAGSALYALGFASIGTTLLTSTDGGSSWTSADVTGIPLSGGVDVTSIAASDNGDTVYVGTTAGLYKGAAR